MGFKDTLIDRPPTIGDLRRQGVLAFRVKYQRPCKRLGHVTLDALRLPDRQIPKLRRLRCEACDRCVPDLEPIWPRRDAEPVGAADTTSACWVLTIQEADGPTGVTSPLWSRTHAAQFARRQIAEGFKILQIETPTDAIDSGDVAEWLEAADRA